MHQVDPARRDVDPRTDIKSLLVTQWLEREKKEHLVLPTEDKTVLPYQDLREAHAMFVLDCESTMNFEHAKASQDMAFQGQQAAQDCEEAIEEEDVVLDVSDEAIANAFAQAKPQQSRYGNTVMGPRGSIPEHPQVASFNWFCSVWKRANGGAYKKTIKLRKWMPFAKCTECATFRSKRMATEDKEERAKLKARQREHLQRVKRERVSYMVRQRLAIKYPERYLSLIIDGADSSPYQVPHMAVTLLPR